MDQADKLRAMALTGKGKREPRIISVTSGKGGVGKTNIAANLAISFARRDLKVLLIDADLGLANANVVLGCRVSGTIEGIIFGEEKFEDVFIKTEFGFDLLPGSSGIRRLLELDAFTQRTVFDQLFKHLRNYDIVIYDTAPGLGTHVLNFNSSAHDIIVVTLPEPTSIADAYALIKVLAKERRETHFKLLVNRTFSGQEGMDVFKKISEVSDEFLSISLDYLGALPEDAAVLKAVHSQKPILITQARSGFALGIERIADKLLATRIRKNLQKMWNTDGVTEAVVERGLYE